MVVDQQGHERPYLEQYFECELPDHARAYIYELVEVEQEAAVSGQRAYQVVRLERKSVVKGKSVDLSGRRIIKKKKRNKNCNARIKVDANIRKRRRERDVKKHEMNMSEGEN